MQKHLYFVCPTDHLETVINKTYNRENYFCTSLGNSISFGNEMILQLIELIESKSIEEISFILSDDNCIVLDAMGKSDFSTISGLNQLYCQILKSKEHYQGIWVRDDLSQLILSYHLNWKTDELRLALKDKLYPQLPIHAKIYVRGKCSFRNVYSSLIYQEYLSLN